VWRRIAQTLGRFGNQQREDRSAETKGLPFGRDEFGRPLVLSAVAVAMIVASQLLVQ